MTILYATARQSFIVLAADGATTRTTAEGKITASPGAMKIWVAPSRKLAIGISGFVYLADQPTVSLVADLVEESGGADSHTLAIRILDKLGTVILAERFRFKNNGIPVPNAVFAIAQITSNGADLAFAKVEGGPQGLSVTRAGPGGVFFGPNCLRDYGDRELATDEARGSRIATMEELRLKAIEIVVRSVNAERDIHGVNQHCGFPVAIAIVEEAGVKVDLVEPAE